jgi:5'-3' exonuclease, N-terminal resolvase-like domain
MTEKSIVPKVDYSQKEDNRRIALFDADFIPYYVCHNKKNEEGVVVEKSFDDCKRLADEFVANILRDTKATYYVMAFTVGKCFRYKVNPYYKANRKYTDVIPFLKETKEYLIEAYKGFYEKDYLEADDLVNILRNRFLKESFIVSPDKDILNLEGKHYNPRIGKWEATNKNEAEVYFWSSMITGDATDGIKGLPGKGIAFSKRLFEKSTVASSTSIFRELVFDAYIEHFGEYEGIEEFYKNYKMLKILDEDKTVITPDLQIIKPKEETLNEIK